GAGVGGDIHAGRARLDLRTHRQAERERCEREAPRCGVECHHSASFLSFWPLRKSSDQIFSQRSFSSSVMTGSIIWNANLLSWVSTERLEGTRFRSLMIVWPSFDSMKSANANAAYGCGARLQTPTALGRPKVGVIAFHLTGAPLTASRSTL